MLNRPYRIDDFHNHFILSIHSSLVNKHLIIYIDIIVTIGI